MIAKAPLVLASASFVACAHGAAAGGPLPRHVRDLRACYDIGLSRDPSLTGRARLDFAIEPSGATTGATLHASTLANADVENCLVDIVSRWRFPPSKARREVSYPLAFAPEEDLVAPPSPP